MDIYYVDCENVGLKHILQKREDYKVIYFTNKDLRVKDLKENEQEFVCSLDRRKDALDYIIDTCLGYSIANNNKNVRHHIVSNDTGFDNVVIFWLNQGFKVSRSCLHNYSDSEEVQSIERIELKELEFLVRRLTNRNRFKLYTTYKRFDATSSTDMEELARKIKTLKLVKDYTNEDLNKLVDLIINTDSGLVLKILGS